jgi:hypothetical protein
MIHLAGTSDLLRVITSAAADIEAHVSYVENNAGTITPGRTNTASITTATTTTILGSPGASIQRRAKHINLRNNHASTSCDVTVTHEDGTNTETLVKASLLPGEVLVCDSKGEWHHYDANGGEYPSNSIIASRAEMEGGTSLTSLVTPGRQHFHPGHPKAWCKAGVTGNILASYNMTSVTDVGAGRAGFNFDNDFADIGYSVQASVQRTNTNSAVTDWKTVTVRMVTQNPASVELEVYDFTATTTVQEDPTAYHLVALGRQV